MPTRPTHERNKGLALDRSLIARLPLFKGLTAAELDEMLRGARSVRYPKQSAVFEQEAEAHSFFVLLDGHIRVVRTTPEGHQVIVRYISEGEIFGVAAALGRTTYPASAIAAVDCVALVWPNALWSELSLRFPSFGANTYKTVGSRLQETHTRVVELSTEQVEQRVAHALLRLVNQTGQKTDQGIEIDFPISRQDIAEMTGTTLHTVSRLLSAWEERGLIVSGRQKVTVKDPHALVVLAEHRDRR
ncbi:cyclic nucleotide-binding protein [Mesorhizobium alhagi CCNWXJ12-2]|uniref:Cyclic nucleotide-binding protein n=1 Tax=Mesorhizobium alhagi CCNWXJ12-2 TaxID=1107882 RepID=H0I1F0_9HYPH|nr:cyclic nucleotide-binding protein [Mesorhizobium alhagi CCNWXJ12-2]